MTTSINKIMKNRKNKKGFSLIELIIVLVIMAILAAALVPTLVGYIRQTRESNAKNEAAACVSATQTIVSSAFADPDGIYHNATDGDGGSDLKLDASGLSINGTAEGTDADIYDVIEALAEVSGEASDLTVSDGLVTKLVYTDGDTTVTYEVTGGVGAYTVA